MASPTDSFMNIDECKSYATEDNRLTALATCRFDPTQALVVRNREGRYTAIFGFSHYDAAPAFRGFMVIN